jgi:phospholipid/cholesterol/gamma-HCH transport system substrate-binding protein
MDRRRNELQVGLVTIVSLAILVVGMMWLKDATVGRGQNRYSVNFPTVEGLQVGDRIQVRGTRAGQVECFTVMDGYVRVGIKLDDSISLRDDAQVTLGTKGIVGEVVIEILPGEGAPVQEGHIFEGRTAATITQMTDVAGAALEKMSGLTSELNELVAEIRREGKLIETMTEANAALNNFNALVEENRRSLDEVMANLAAASGDLERLMASGHVDSAFSAAAAAASRADTLMTQLAVSARRLDSVMAKLDEGEGSAALLLNDPALYLRADSTMTSLQRLLDEMRRNPKKFVNLSVF